MQAQDKPVVVPAKIAKGRKLVKTGTPGIYRRGGRYCVVVAVNGRQVKRSAKTLAEARAIKASLTADVSRGEYRELSRQTFGAYASGWIETYSGRTQRGVGEQTIADYRTRLQADAIRVLGRVPLASLTPQHVKKLAADVASRGCKPNTVRLALAPVRACLADAFEEGLIRSNPAAGVRIAKPRTVEVAELNEDDEGPVKRLSDAELAAFLAECPEAWRLFFRFLSESGLRIGEASEVRFRDLDAETRTLHVRRRIYRGKIDKPKGRKTRRVRLSVEMALELAADRQNRQADDDALIFTTERGGRIDPSNIMARVLKPTADAIGVGRWPGFHTFRHTAASRLFVGGWNAKQVAKFLGHSDAAFTIRTYIHLLDEDLPEVPFGATVVPLRAVA